jgi:hypothetical protein
MELYNQAATPGRIVAAIVRSVLSEETRTVHRSIDHKWYHHCVMTQAGHKGDGLPVALWHVADQSQPARAAPAQPCHVGRRRGLVNEYQPGRIKQALLAHPAPARPRHVWRRRWPHPGGRGHPSAPRANAARRHVQRQIGTSCQRKFQRPARQPGDVAKSILEKPTPYTKEKLQITIRSSVIIPQTGLSFAVLPFHNAADSAPRPSQFTERKHTWPALPISNQCQWTNSRN